MWPYSLQCPGVKFKVINGIVYPCQSVFDDDRKFLFAADDDDDYDQ